MSELRVAVVGCGDLGSKHAERWAALPGARVVVVADPQFERAQALGARLRADPLADYHVAIARTDVDVVSVAVPTCFHSEISVRALDARKHVLCEKPMALTLGQAEAMLTASRRSGAKLGIGLMRRHSPVMAALRAWLADGRLARPALYWSSDIRELRPKRAMHDDDQNGGPAIDMAVHYFDTWAYVFDSQPTSVHAHGLTLAAARPELAQIVHKAPDTVSITVRYASGDIGTTIITWGLPPGVVLPPAAERIYTPNGMVEAEFHMRRQSARVTREGAQVEPIAESDGDMYAHEIAAFAESIRGDRPVHAAGEEGLAALRVALAARESMRTGAVVTLGQDS